MSVLAHGIGGRSDLPIPLWLAVYAAAMAVLISFFAVVAFWPTSRLTGDAAGRALPAGAQRLADAPATRLVLRLIGLAAAAVFFGAAWFGSSDSAANPTPTWFYVWFWVGLVPASVLFGPVWRLFNPLRTVATGLLAVRGGRPVLASAGARAPTGGPGDPAGGRAATDSPDDQAGRDLVARLGYWPAVLGIAAFVWLELVSIRPDLPRHVAVFATGYAVVQVVAGVLVGPRWFDRGDAFEAYSSLLARLSPLGRRPDGRLALRNPLDNLAGLTPAPGLVALVCVVLGSTAFDGLSRTTWWRRLTNGAQPPRYLTLGTVGLAVAVLAVATLYLAALTLTRRYVRRADAGRGLAGRLVHSLVPIAVGYTAAHYFSLVVFQGQAGYLLATDPFGRGWDLLGSAGHSIDYRVVSTSTIALIQVGAIVAGHIVGVVAAHDRAVALLPRRSARRGQYPLLAAMVGYTCLGIALLVGT